MINIDILRKEYKELEKELAQQEVLSDKRRYAQLAQRFSYLEGIIKLADAFSKLSEEENHLKAVIADVKEAEDVRQMAKEELARVEQKKAKIEETIEEKLFDQEQQYSNNVIIEIRAGTGGQEAALFAADLFKMYSHFVAAKGWKLEILSSHPTEMGGAKEIIFAVHGEGAQATLKFESGVHRVQRVPVTESGGRIHTSTATVAVLVEPSNVDLDIKPEELKIETFRASGAGGQHVNVTDSAVRITHIPTGITVSCQDERSQIKNREKALRVLKAKVLDAITQKQQKERGKERKYQIGSGDRSEKVRTYNFPERRVTEHRINLTLYKLEDILTGNLDLIIKELKKAERKKYYEAQGLAEEK